MIVKDDDGVVFNFDEWVELAKSGPDAFESLRAQAVEQSIASSLSYRLGDAERRVAERKLRGLQFTIDSKRSMAKNQLHARMLISEMFYKQVFGDGGFADAMMSCGSRMLERCVYHNINDDADSRDVSGVSTACKTVKSNVVAFRRDR